MNRRSLLRALGASGGLLGGYVGGIRVANSPARSMSITAGVSADDRLTADGTVRQPFSDDRPASVELTVRNDGPEPLALSFPAAASSLSAPATPVSNLVARRDGERSALLLFPDDRQHVAPVLDPVPIRRGLTNCWYARTTHWGQNDLVEGERLEPGESIAGTYTVLDLPSLPNRALPGDCLESGRYKLSQQLDFVHGQRASTSAVYEIELS